MKIMQQFLLEREYSVFDDRVINEMVNLGKNTTKLPVIIYISDNRGVNHGPRIKVNSEYGNTWSGSSFTITIDAEPRVIGDTKKIKKDDMLDIIDWVKLNKEILLSYWKQDIDIAEVISGLKYIYKEQCPSSSVLEQLPLRERGGRFKSYPGAPKLG